jgi:predicted transcriptional regulator of viral defense system
VAKALYLAQEKVDMLKLFTYTREFQSQAVIKRLGFLLEPLEINSPIIEKLKKIKSLSIILLDPAVPASGKILNHWSIQQNVDSFTIQSSVHT